jgi:hypothetical protein
MRGRSLLDDEAYSPSTEHLAEASVTAPNRALIIVARAAKWRRKLAIILPLAIVGGLATGYVATDGYDFNRSSRDVDGFAVQSFGETSRKTHAICDEASGGSGRLEACGRGITGGGSNTGGSSN